MQTHVETSTQTHVGVGGGENWTREGRFSSRGKAGGLGREIDVHRGLNIQTTSMDIDRMVSLV